MLCCLFCLSLAPLSVVTPRAMASDWHSTGTGPTYLLCALHVFVVGDHLLLYPGMLATRLACLLQGYFLLFESMLDSVLFARNKWLAPGGHLLPDQAGMWLAALDEKSGHASRIGYWDDVYGFRMSCMRKPILKEAAITVVPPESIMSNVASLREVAIASVTPEDLQFDAPFQLVMKRETKLTVGRGGERAGVEARWRA